jgi:2-desacetyl-2-hydroxyethyl bacteriochlorophyllide A dehydrogenase
MGHECAGVIDAVGADAEGWSEGDRVVVFPFPPVERHELSLALSCLGYGTQGAFAERVVVGTDRLWRLPDVMSFDVGALVEPLAVALHALNVVAVRADEPAVVVGAGPVGVMTALALRARGVDRLAVVERNEFRRARLAGFGLTGIAATDAHGAVLAALGGEPSVVLECAGHPSATALALQLVAPSGRVGLLGVMDEPVEISQLLLMIKEAALLASFAYRPGDFDEAIALLADGAVPGEQLITRRADLADAQLVVDDLETPTTEQLKVLFHPNG